MISNKMIKKESWLKILSLFMALLLILPLCTDNVSAVSSVDGKDAERLELQTLVQAVRDISPADLAGCPGKYVEQLLYSTEKAEMLIDNPGFSTRRVRLAILELQVALDMLIVDFQYSTIDDMQNLVKDGKLSYEDLTRMYLTRIELYEYNTIELNSILELRAGAIDDARKCDQELAADPGLASGMFGIPVFVKGNINVIGIPNASGSIALSDNYPSFDAPLVANLKAAGAVVMGTLNLTEFANSVDSSMPAGFCALGGQVRNPYRPVRLLGDSSALTPSGSSAGSGAAAAAALAAITVGTETTGSILSPASRNCLAAVKPTVGLISRYGVIPISITQDTAGPMGRNVTDLAILLNAMAGYDPNDPFTEGIEAAGVTGVDYTANLKPGDLTGMRIGLTIVPAANSAYYSQWQTALQALRDAGAVIVTNANGSALTYPTTSGTNNGLILDYEFKRDLAAYLATTDPSYPIKSLADVIAFNLAYEAHSPGVAIPYRQRWLIASDAVDLVGQKAAYDQAIINDGRYGRDNGIDYVLRQNNLDAIIHTGTHDRAARAGYPVVSIPLQYAGGSGASTNMIFIGTAFTEAKLLEIAYVAEQATNSRLAPGMADKSSLQVAIGAAQRLPANVRALFQATYNSSLSVYNDSFLPQMDIDKADAALRGALLDVTEADKTLLNEIVELALSIDPDYLSPAIAEKFADLLEAALDAETYELSLPEEVNSAYTALFNLMKDPSFLQSMVDYANMAKDTMRLKESFPEALSNAQAVLDDPASSANDYFDAIKMLNDALEPVVLLNAAPQASVEKLTGNMNILTIVITEYYSDGTIDILEGVISIRNNAADIYNVDGYQVYVDTKGNTQIRDCYIIY